MSFGQTGAFPNYGSTTAQTEIRPRSMSDESLYNQLCDNISCNIFSINNNVAALETAYKDIGTKLDSVALRDKIHKDRQTSNDLVKTTTRFLTELQRIVRTDAAKEHRFQAKRLENEFGETVRRYDALQKQLVPKMKQASWPSERTTHGGSFGDNDGETLVEIDQQQQMVVEAEMEFEIGLMLERDERIRQIEEDVLDVNATFKELGKMVHEQGDMIGNIEENITYTAHQVEDGAQQLSKASEYQKKYRTKLCWLILIMLFISGIVTIIIVVETR